MTVKVCLSVVSHGHREHLSALMGDLTAHKLELEEVRVLANIPEELSGLGPLVNGRVVINYNNTPIGFGSNHNNNLAESNADYFLIINPDVRLTSNPIPELLAIFEADPSVGLVAPRVIASDGCFEDSIRRFPSLIDLFKKALGNDQGAIALKPEENADVPWVAGMFMLVRRDVFNALGGFDERFYLYYEDVDLCARIHLAGYKVRVSGKTTVIHNAQRDSRRKLKFMIWHLKSMARYFLKYGFTGRLNAQL
ncbi:Rhamnosyltransferase WbbL [Marinobacterium sp. xm-d-420]|uniref:glycosyltransferase n=1 Tax=Marinobacterium sp. xm-d-420 TaxID=2497737 RepID=UPI00156A1636|nr:glycosyltransferase family 2 protein [Marinobacterium sp. xm-d-420]NRP26526.1 Rhamnosyltransferase WbbL [Marinobacterium sp. xm-d-420]